MSASINGRGDQSSVGPHERAPADGTDPSNVAFERIRTAILQGDLVPRQRLIEVDLCEQFELTRTAVRSALHQLSTEGLVEIQRNKGARVRAISLQEAIEITEIRLQIESFVASRAADRVDPARARELRRITTAMRRAIKDSDIRGYGDLNVEFHRLIREIADHHTATRVLDQLNAQSARHHIRLAMAPGRPTDSLAQHETIAAAIAAGDGVAAADAMREHISSVIDSLRKLDAER